MVLYKNLNDGLVVPFCTCLPLSKLCTYVRRCLTGNTARQADYITWNAQQNIDWSPAIQNRSRDMKDILQTIALILGFLGCGSAVLSLHSHYWKVSSDDDSVIVTSNIFENLWMSCADDSTGTFNCRDFQSMLALPGKLHPW